ncbi:tRNA 2-selenouridine(34) synthase MnmH [Geobacter sp. DSM 9736]|uniref:tRNA 2-selenouridine(34) synthase MnmH n=1 Tax=Geobacter sp. DSM 9736 TaxID=1277350 RepID=UPI000B50BD6A|nr:tRNA 2-selenouridine(34) synthase MnmH [Geobacter sp. DSM 9736]SNB46030.1 tRNA 2-selenouridine synthase [Geobacter sp. DSM 9736]
MKSLPFDPALLDTHCIVDVRSPAEFDEDHLPGAVNVPLLDNEERAEIGTIHKHQGPLEARRRGLELTAHRFPAMVAQIGAQASGRPILVYCWRGGLRSKTVVSILDLTGYPAVQLTGGYKSFRAQVVSYFEPFNPPAPLVVFHGMTGIGKTTFLQKLGHRYPVVDLEGLACHRGSAFGEVGLRQTLSQKRFETLLWDSFRRLQPGVPILVEGESRRIGKVSLPGDMYDRMRQSVKVWCQASLETRVTRLIAEYGCIEYKEEMERALQRIRKKLGEERYREIAEHLDRWELEPFMMRLMADYYDKVYYKTREWQEDAVICLEDFTAAEGELDLFLNQILGRDRSS